MDIEGDRVNKTVVGFWFLVPGFEHFFEEKLLMLRINN
jgi:hypothetical protein